MSTNAQAVTCHIKEGRKPVVRGALIRAPIELFLLDNSRNRSRLKREVSGLKLPKFAETQIPVETYYDVFERVGFLGQGDELFLRAGLNPDLSSIGLFGKAVALAPTVWDAVATAKDGFQFCLSSAQQTVHLRRGRCKIVVDPGKGSGRGHSANVQYMIALYTYLLRQASKSADLDLRLTYPGAKSAHFTLFPEAVSLRSGPVGIIEFNEAVLRSSMDSGDTKRWLVSKYLVRVFKEKNLEVSELSELVKEMQIASLKSSNCPFSLQDAAALLDLPVRTVQAHLKMSKSSFADVRNGVLHDRARTALRNGLSISETSALLGFAQRQNFSEAFSKWEGQSPSEFASRERTSFAS